MNSAKPVQRPTNWDVMWKWWINDWKCVKIMYVNYELINKYESDLRSHDHYLSNSENQVWKIRLDSPVGWALRQYRRGLGFKSSTSLNSSVHHCVDAFIFIITPQFTYMFFIYLHFYHDIWMEKWSKTCYNLNKSNTYKIIQLKVLCTFIRDYYISNKVLYSISKFDDLEFYGGSLGKGIEIGKMTIALNEQKMSPSTSPCMSLLFQEDFANPQRFLF